MYLIYKKIKKRNERKRLEAVVPSTSDTNQSQPEISLGAPVINYPNSQAVLSSEEALEKRRKRTYRWKIIFGLFSPFCLQALDTTIVASALPFIAEDFSESLP
jgi:hypothetical protein